MFTNRSTVFFLIGCIILGVGIVRYHEGAAFAGLTILLWLAIQWFTVNWSILSAKGTVSDLKRTIDGQNEQDFALAVGQEYTVCLSGNIRPGRRGFQLSIRDLLPESCQVVSGYSRLVLDKSDESSFALTYRMTPLVCGRMSMMGAMVSMQDPNGMFQAQSFEFHEQKLTVLPFLIRAETTASVLKTNNVQRVLGHHRHKSPGISAELLGIRDYVPGDPPRTIAWKPTARLGRLMSCEFESEVPVRANIFADLSSYQMTGRPGAAVADRVITATASIARLLLSDRDPVSFVIATENGTARMPHGQGERQLSRMMHYLLVAADPNSRLEYLSDNDLVEIVFREAYRRFPRLFDKRYNFVPIGRSLFRLWRNKSHRIKCRLAPVLCEKLDFPFGHEMRLIHDADAMRVACEAWTRKFPLATLRIRPASMIRDQTLREATNVQLCGRIMEARARARDNELFVIVGALPKSIEESDTLLDVVRACRAANHRVVFVDAGFPGKSTQVEDPVARKLLEATEETGIPDGTSFAGQELITMGARCAKITDPALMKKVAIEIDLIRSGASRGANASRGSFSVSGRQS